MYNTQRSLYDRSLEKTPEQDMVRVELTLDGGIEDLDILHTQGCQALRQLNTIAWNFGWRDV